MVHEEYIQYHINNASKWEIDTHLDAAVWFADKHRLDIEQRYWLAFLTAICETTPTSLYLFSHFPSVERAEPREFALFCDTHRGAMVFQYDVRWILYGIEGVLQSYKALLGGRKQSEIIPTLAKGATAKLRYQSFCRLFKVHKFGKYVFMLYTELLHYLCGVDFDAYIDPADNHSVRSGLIYACGYEDIIHCVKSGTRPTAEENALLKIELDCIYDTVQGLDILQRHKRMWAIETTLCTYNKTRHGRRYLGFYQNRQAKEIKRLVEYTRSAGEPFDWSELIEYHNNWGNWNVFK